MPKSRIVHKHAYCTNADIIYAIRYSFDKLSEPEYTLTLYALTVSMLHLISAVIKKNYY